MSIDPTDLVAISNQVLRRDAAKTDYIVIPLVAGVLARALIAAGPSDHPEDTPESNAKHQGAAQAVLDLGLRRGPNDSWESDAASYGMVADLLFDQWPGLLSFASHSYANSVLRVPFGARSAVMVAAAVEWLGTSPPPSLTESAIMSMLVSMFTGPKKGEHPVLAKSTRRIRVALADRLRRDGLTTWPLVLAAAIDDWNLATLEQLALHHAGAGDSYLHETIDRTEQLERIAAETDAELAREVEIVAAENEKAISRLQLVRDPETSTAELLVAEAAKEIAQSRADRDRVQRERDQVADRHARATSRIDSLETELDRTRAALAAAEAELRALRREAEQLAEHEAAHDALVDGAPPIPPDTFTGRRVLLFTGVGAADARAALAEGFVQLGAAQVDIYWTDKMRGPDSFPQDGIIAVEVSHMGHSDWESVQDRVRKAGAWSYTGKHGAATMARATAAAWRAHQMRMSEAAG